MLVTNAHVLHAFDQKLRDDSSLRLIIGGNGKTCIVDRNWLKDYYRNVDLKLDLATFVLPDEVDPTILVRHFTNRSCGRPQESQQESSLSS